MILLNPQLEAFISVVNHHTVLDGAKALSLTQTAVTQRILQLESALGTTLFIRSRRGMTLTQEGQALMRYCMSAQELAGATLAQIQRSGVNTQVRVSIVGPTSILSSRIVSQCIPVMEHFSDLLLSFDVSDLPNRSELLKTGVAHLAILPKEEVGREMDSKILKPENYVLVCSPRWKGRAIEDIVKKERIIDFSLSDSMSFSYLRKFKLLKFVNSDRHFVNNNTALVEMFKNGIGYGVLTQEVADSFLRNGDLMVLNDGNVLENRLALAWYPRPNPPAYWTALIRAIR